MMLLWALVLCLMRTISSVPIDDIPPIRGSQCGYDSCVSAETGVLNVHIVPHTHDDVGWLKTVDQYYYGSRNNIQLAGVQYIIDSVVKELWEDPKRRFMYVETAFFWKWWMAQSVSVREKVHTLVREGRLQFVGGAWSMNDEAAAHYHSTVDQFTWGLSKLNQTFGPCGMPRVGWQIDPFGHSREFASLLAAMGYDGLFLGRIDYQDKSRRLHEKTMEMLWRGDDDLGKASDIFTGVLYNTYSPPPGFCFDVLCSDEPIIDDPDSPMFNVDERISNFLTYVQNQAKHYRTNNVIITMGGDFTYQDATMWYKNLDKLITYGNLKAAKDGLDIKLFYSTPDCYLKAVKDANPILPTKQDDFFPYASDSTAYWTGYFSSRPTTKYFEREGNNYLQTAKQLQAWADLNEHNMFVLDELKSAMGVMQHHDAITGTEKQHVTHDYERMLNAAIEDAMVIPRQAFNKLMQGDALKPSILSFDRCRFNESSCPTSEDSDSFVVTVYNPVGWSLDEPISIPVQAGTYDVYAPNGEVIVSQLVELPNAVLKIPTRESKATHELVFIAYLPALGYKNFYIKKTSVHNRNIREIQKKDAYISLDDYWREIKEDPDIDIVHDKEPLINNDLNERLAVLEEPQDKINESQDEINEPQDKINEPKSKVSDVVIIIPPSDTTTIGFTTEKDVDLNILKDKDNDFNESVLQLEKIIKESKKKVENDRMEKKAMYERFKEDELRMMSDGTAVVEQQITEDTFLENQRFRVRINNTTGEITTTLVNSDQNYLTISVKFYYYPGCVGNNVNPANRSSGAYIFRPNATKPFAVTRQNIEVKTGPVFKEFRVNLSHNVAYSVRLYEETLTYDTDWIVGPIPIEDGVGKEFVVRYETNIRSNGEFYTDSNGRQMLKRKLNERPQWNVTLAEPIPGNYYPVTNVITINDDSDVFTVLTDRSHGGTSLADGEVELMLHRRLLHDDAFGVGEALNEVANKQGLVARGQNRVFVTKKNKKDENRNVAKNVVAYSLRPRVFVSNANVLSVSDWVKLKNKFSGLNKNLPEGVHLLTLEPWYESRLLIRFENYLNNDISDQPNISIDVADLFKTIKIVSMKETTLSGNIWLKDYTKWDWSKANNFFTNFNKAYGAYNEVDFDKGKANRPGDSGSIINLTPKEIRTFIVEYSL